MLFKLSNLNSNLALTTRPWSEAAPRRAEQYHVSVHTTPCRYEKLSSNSVNVTLVL